MIKKIILSIFITFICSLPLVYATPTEWHNMPVSEKDPGDIFQLRFEIKSDETTNYTIVINPGDDFESINGNTSMTIEIPVDATRTFIFDMKVNNTLEDGKHPILYIAYKDKTQFKTGNIYVRAGTQTPGFEILILFVSVIIILFIAKKRDR